jgi:hypothetical protein
MAQESSVIVGSGLNPLKDAVPVNTTTGERHLRGTQVVVVNPEDASAGGSGLVTPVTVSTTAVKLPATPLPYRRAMAIANQSSSVTLYIGFDPSVTTSTGFPLGPGVTMPVDLNGSVQIYGIATSSIDVRVLELS